MQTSSIGIIGGADGPTAVFVTGNMMPLILVAAVTVLAMIAGLFFFKK